MLSLNLHSNDGHRAVDFSVRRTQNTKGMSSHRLHTSHLGRCRLFTQFKQILSVTVIFPLQFSLLSSLTNSSTSRVSIKESSVLKLGSVCRRVYRIFSHAYFHHRRIFNEFEEETSLCLRFTHFVTKYNLMSKDNLIVPISDNALGDIPGESEA